MKIIDDKGRLFGRLNIIDLLAILLILAVGALLAARLLGGRSDSGGGQTAYMTYMVRVEEVSPEMYETVRAFVDPAAGKRDQLMASEVMLDGYVVDCQAAPHVTYVESDDGQVRAVESSGEDARLDLTFRIEALVTDTVTNKVGTQEVRVGVNHIVKTVHFEFPRGTVTGAEWVYSGGD